MGQIHLDRALPTLQNPKLGWIVSGGLSTNMPTHKSVLRHLRSPLDVLQLWQDFYKTLILAARNQK